MLIQNNYLLFHTFQLNFIKLFKLLQIRNISLIMYYFNNWGIIINEFIISETKLNLMQSMKFSIQTKIQLNFFQLDFLLVEFYTIYFLIYFINSSILYIKLPKHYIFKVV